MRLVGSRCPSAALAVLAVLGACALSACADRRIDLRNVEAAMRDRYGRDAGVPIEAVTCPEWVRTRKGEKFECQVRFQGGVAWTIDVVELDDGSTQWLPRGQAVFADEIEPWLSRTLAAQGRESRVTCHARVYVLEPGKHAMCTATGADGRASEVRIELDQVEGLRVVE
jgi:Domain of unknown function (DUF4333)